MNDGTADTLARMAVEEWSYLDPDGADRETLVGAIVLKLILVKAAERQRCELIVSRMLKAIHDGEETTVPPGGHVMAGKDKPDPKSCDLSQADLLRQAGFWIVRHDGTLQVSHQDHWHTVGEKSKGRPSE